MLIDPSEIRVLGPLAPFAAGFADELARQGYTPHSARYQMRLMAHLSRWLVHEGLDAGDLRTTEVERFLRSRRAAGYTCQLSIKAVRPILAYLRIGGVATHCRRPRPAVRWKWRWNDTGAI